MTTDTSVKQKPSYMRFYSQTKKKARKQKNRRKKEAASRLN